MRPRGVPHRRTCGMFDFHICITRRPRSDCKFHRCRNVSVRTNSPSAVRTYVVLCLNSSFAQPATSPRPIPAHRSRLRLWPRTLQARLRRRIRLCLGLSLAVPSSRARALLRKAVSTTPQRRTAFSVKISQESAFHLSDVVVAA